MYLILWEFRTTKKRRRDFVRAYGANGAWARLFRTAPGYISTRLLPDPQDPLRFFTLDLWQSREAFAGAKRALGSRYVALDAACTKLTAKETRIAAFSLRGQVPK